MRVTTDTPEYCLSLARRVDQDRRTHSGAGVPAGLPAGSPPPATTQTQAADGLAAEVTELTIEGERMCDQGLVVGGITRLRRAWMLLHPSD